jgi:protein SCO1
VKADFWFHISRSLSMLAVAFLVAGCGKPSATTALQRDDLSLPLADFELIERNGKTVKKDDLKGKVWIASFIFTRCTEHCPQVTSTVARLQSELAGEQDVRFVTFTVDPARDKPDELNEYAKIYRADPARWLFLTGKEEAIRRLLVESFKVPSNRNENAKNVSQEYDHSTRLAVVDKQGNVRGYFQGMANPEQPNSTAELDAELQKLKEKVKALLAE